MSDSLDLFERALKKIPGGVNSPVRAFRSVGGTPFFTEKAQGAYLYTSDDKKLLDYVCTWGPAIHGHNHAFIKDAISTAAAKGTSFGTPGPSEVVMAELLSSIVPSIQKVRMVNSGTEATMTAIRLARGYTGRDKIIKFEGCYHGHADSLLVAAGSGAMTLGQPDSAGVPASFAEQTVVLPLNNIDRVRETLEQMKGQIACIIIEPYPANCGLLLPQPGYLQKLRDLCTEHNVILIFDEVMTGFRVSLGGVQEKEDITPDLTALGKIIGGGLPVGAVGGKSEIMDYLAPLGPVYQAGTLSGNPLAMAAGIAALTLLKSEDPYAKLWKLTEQLVQSVKDVAEVKGIPLQVPYTTSMFCLFFSEEPVVDYTTAAASQTDKFKSVFAKLLEAGIYLPPSPFETCFISTAHTTQDIEFTAVTLTKALSEL